MSGGLLAVHAHPDDETLSTGALLATWAASGSAVTLVTCTRGERGEVIGEHRAALEGDGPALAAHRTGELGAAARALGIRDRVLLDEIGGDGPWVDSGMVWDSVGRARAGATIPDGAFVGVDLELAAGRLAELLLERRPDVVVTYEPAGGYGHPDHVQAHRVTMRAVELAFAGSPSAPCVLWAALDEDALRRGYRECVDLGLAVDGLLAPDPHGAVPSAAVPASAVDVQVQVAPVLDRVLAALRSHATQVQAVQVVAGDDADRAALAVYALSNGILQPLLAVESYRCAAGDLARVHLPQGVLVR
ncbi:PIG-L family deacetylase [Actinotalea sp.]|uniref:PIG-L family deacetylase n=1 Tax=Actinotalea sp. TaxID=1872145 RepID=UPI0035689B2C